MTYICLDIKVGVDGSASAEVDLVPYDDRLTLLALNVDTSCVTRDDLVIADLHQVLRTRLDHDTARLEVLQIASLYFHVCVDGDDASGASTVCGVTLQLAIFHLDFGTVEHCNARDLAVSLTEDSTRSRKRIISIGIGEGE